MDYRIWDNQINEFFSRGEAFKSKKEACERLISYHEVDTDMRGIKKLLEDDRVDECWEELSMFDWELIPIKYDKISLGSPHGEIEVERKSFGLVVRAYNENGKVIDTKTYYHTDLADQEKVKIARMDYLEMRKNDPERYYKWHERFDEWYDANF